MKKYIVALALFAIPLVSFASIDQDLRYGSSGPEVNELQEYLIANGFLTTQSTGNFYSLTRKAVVAYQTSVRLPATGFVGPLTRGLINADLASSTSPDEAQATAIVTPSNDTSALQKQLSDLLTQVQVLIAQQKTQTDATNAQTQVIAQVAQNTTPAPVFGNVEPATPAPVVPVSIEVTPVGPTDTGSYAFLTRVLNSDNSYSSTSLVAMDAPGNLSEDRSDYYANTHQVTNANVDYDSNRKPIGNWSVSFGYLPKTSGTKTITFTSGNLTKSITMDILDESDYRASLLNK